MFGRTRIFFYYKPDDSIFGVLMVTRWISIIPAVASPNCWAGIVLNIIWWPMNDILFRIYEYRNIELTVAPPLLICYRGSQLSLSFYRWFSCMMRLFLQNSQRYILPWKILDQKRYCFIMAFICRSWRRSSVVTQKCYQNVFFLILLLQSVSSCSYRHILENRQTCSMWHNIKHEHRAMNECQV